MNGDFKTAFQAVRWSVKAVPQLLGGINRLHECDPGSEKANLILTQRVGEDHYGQNELQRVKSEILREETLAAHKTPPKKQADLRSQTVPRCDRTLLHAGSLSLGRNFHQRHVTPSLLEDLRESSRKIED